MKRFFYVITRTYPNALGYYGLYSPPKEFLIPQKLGTYEEVISVARINAQSHQCALEDIEIVESFMTDESYACWIQELKPGTYITEVTLKSLQAKNKESEHKGYALL